MCLPIPRLFLPLLFFMLAISVADAETVQRVWVLTELSGSVEINDAAQAKLGIQIGTRLAAPFTVDTGDDGHVVLIHGQDKITVSPNSRIAVPRPEITESGVITLIRQLLGSVLYHDEHRIKDGFEVATPYLVSVVKGTTFNIRVTTDDTTVALIEGSLFVHTPDMKAQLMLKPGQAAIKSRFSTGIILKDQQTLSAPLQGPISVAKDGDAVAATDKSGGRSGDQSGADGKPETSSGIRVDLGDNSLSPSGKHRVVPSDPIAELNASSNVGSAADPGASVGGAASHARVGPVSNLGVTTSTGIGGSSLNSLGASVGGVAATTRVGGSSPLSVGATATPQITGGASTVVAPTTQSMPLTTVPITVPSTTLGSPPTKPVNLPGL